MRKLSKDQLSGMNCHYAHHTFTYYLDSLAANGIKNLEIWGASPHYHIDDVTPEITADVKKEIAGRGLHLVCLTPETVVYPVNIAAPETYLRERSVKTLLKALECTIDLDCRLMLVTPGWGYITAKREEGMKYSLDSLSRLLKRAVELGVTIGFEHLSPISSNLVNTSAQVREVLDTFNSPNFKALVDTGQVGLGGEHLRDYFRVLGKDIVHIHMVDGTPGGHLAFGDGNIPLAEYVKVMEENDYSGYLSMEIADRRYFAHPELADKQSVAAFEKYIAA